MSHVPPFEMEGLIGNFVGVFGSEPDIVVRSPGRVNIVGDHTDYNDGLALPMAIPGAVYIASRCRDDRIVDVSAATDYERASFGLEALDRSRRGWVAYLQGVTHELLEEGHDLFGWDGLVASDLAVGAGLSSSAALELAVARTFIELGGGVWDPRAMAHLCQRAENHWVGVNSGLLDQFSSALGVAGNAMMIDFLTLDVTLVPVPESAALLVLDTGTRRQLVESGYNTRRQECADIAAELQVESARALPEHRLGELEPVLRRRARHLVSENRRVEMVASSFARGDLDTAGWLLTDSHRSLRDDYEVSSDELDVMVESALGVAGVYGARMTGGGFGGAAVALVEAAAAGTIGEEVVARYRSATGVFGNFQVVWPSDGTSLLDGWRHASPAR